MTEHPPPPQQPAHPPQPPGYRAPQQPDYRAPQQPGHGGPQSPGYGGPQGPAPAGQHFGPAPDEPAAPRQPSAFRAFVLTPLPVLKRLWSGDTGSALAYPGEVGQKFGKVHGPWLTVAGTIVVLAMLSGLLGTLVSDLSIRMNAPFGLPAMSYVVSVLITPLLIGVSFVLRVLTIRWTLAVRRVEGASLADAGHLMTTAGSLYVAFWAVLVPLSILPGPAGGSLFTLVSLTTGFVAFLGAELLLYIGVSRRVDSQKSPLVPHLLLSLAHAAMIFLLVAIVLTSNFQAMFYSSLRPFFGF